MTSFDDIVVPVNKIISTNAAYGQHGRIRYLSKEGKFFKKSILDILQTKYNNIRTSFLESYSNTNNPVAIIDYYLIDNWLTKNSLVKRIDLNPRIKLIEDIFFEWLEVDDSIVFSSEQKKIQSNSIIAVLYRLKIIELKEYLLNNKVDIS